MTDDEGDPTPHDRPSAAETAEYVVGVTRELGALAAARGAGFDALAALLRMASVEAEQLRRANPHPPG